MDDLDKSMVALLRKDARMSLSDLSQTLNISRSALRARLHKLQDQGDILGFTVVLRQDVEDAPVRGLMMLAIQGQGTDRIIHLLTSLPQVTAVHATNGKWDLIAEISSQDLAQFDMILSDVRKFPGVVSSETNLLLRTRKSPNRH